TLAELQGLKYKTAANANGTGNIIWTVQDSGGTASGGSDTLSQTLAITINAVNDAPQRTAGNFNDIIVNEDSVNDAPASVGLSHLAYGPGGGLAVASHARALTFKITNIPAFVNLFTADGITAVNADETLSLDDLQGLTYKTVLNGNGSDNLTWTVQDDGGTANGGVDTLTETLGFTVNA